MGLRYLVPTLASTAASTVVPAIYFIALYYDESDFEGAEIGMAIVALHIFASILFTAIAFPIAAYILDKIGALSRARFYQVLFVGLAACVSLFYAWQAIADHDTRVLVFIPWSFVFLALLTMPIRPLWLKLALPSA
jgi:hypothetical protein